MSIGIGSTEASHDNIRHDKSYNQKTASSKIEEIFGNIMSSKLKDDSKDDEFDSVISRMVDENQQAGTLDQHQSEINSKDNDVAKTDYMQVIRDRIDEIFVKIKNNDTEPSYQIGGRSFTEREWDEFLDQFDEVEEALRKLLEEKKEQQMKADERKNIEEENTAVNETNVEMLTMDSVRCTYPKNDEVIMYITVYDETGIRCKASSNIGEEGYLWEIPFSSEEEYRRVCDFLSKFPADANLRFASHDNFWKDFLDNKIDEEDFLDFFLTTNNGEPDYTYTVQDSMYIDKEKAEYAQYINSHGNKMYNAEEIAELMMQNIVKK